MSEMMDEPEYDGTIVSLVAGATAGLSEHCTVYPLDVIRTRMQVRGDGALQRVSVLQAGTEIARREGFRRLWRGVAAVAFGALPAHALYFTVYERSKVFLGGDIRGGDSSVVHAVSGVLATGFHDAVMTPLDVVKQRIQLQGAREKTIRGMVKHIYREGGRRAFFVSYPTTLAMNIPYQSVHFVAYEALRKITTRNGENETLPAHFASGACAGAIAAGLSNPLDVVKTRLQTQHRVGGEYKYTGFAQAFRTIAAEEGPRAFVRGIAPRMMYHAPSAAICWATYEYISKILKPVYGDRSVFTD